jgi:hypothetical protein
MHHIVFGAGALAYVGRAIEQPFGARSKPRWRYWLKWESDATIRLGRLAPECYRTDDGWEEWTVLVKDVEALTDFWHTPPYNSSQKLKYTGQPLWVRNWGNRGSMLPEYTDPTDWEPQRLDDASEE